MSSSSLSRVVDLVRAHGAVLDRSFGRGADALFVVYAGIALESGLPLDIIAPSANVCMGLPTTR